MQPGGAPASSTDPKTWGTFECVLQMNGQFNGIGFVFTRESGYAGIDLDKCRNPKTGVTEKWALAIIEELDSYTELSQSGMGWHVIVKGILPRNGNKRGRLEMYDSKRFFAVTGALLAGVGRGTIETRDLTRLQRRMLEGEFGSSSFKAECKKDESAEDWRLIADIQAQLRTSDPAVLEEAFRKQYPERYSERNREKDERAGKSYMRYTIERFFERGGTKEGMPGDAEQIAPRFSEEALALRFSGKYGDLRYVAAWGKWLRWDGTRWRDDDTLQVFDLARLICREAAAECATKKPNVAPRLAAASTVAAIERLARADRRHAATVNQWDADAWLLNTPTGTIELQSGEQREHRQGDYLTKLTGTGLASQGEDCPLWLSFLDCVTGHCVDLQRFLQRMIGYCLTGSICEHALFFLYGTGANGKSVFTSVIADVLGEYAKTAPISTFLATGNEQHPTDLAGLRGARLVTAIETEDGRRWAEAKIKALTGGDRIAARFMRQDFFEFAPQFKLLIAGNHKPGLRSVDEAIRRRLHLVPFKVTIPAGERDTQLRDKLRSEYPAILRWAVEGCIEWQRGVGLNPPDVVLDATADYLSAEDRLALWIEESCDVGRSCSATAGELYRSWTAWCESAGEKAGSKKRFSQNVQSRGFERKHNRSGSCFNGLAPIALGKAWRWRNQK
jgi:putative DNA primase/helicase